MIFMTLGEMTDVTTSGIDPTDIRGGIDPTDIRV